MFFFYYMLTVEKGGRYYRFPLLEFPHVLAACNLQELHSFMHRIKGYSIGEVTKMASVGLRNNVDPSDRRLSMYFSLNYYEHSYFQL